MSARPSSAVAPAGPSPSAARTGAAPDFSPGFSPRRSPSPQPQQQQHRRGYQACDPCRKRKVKCDLGSVDNPRPPPCVRCRRESKRCEFSATRRKRKTPDDADDSKDNVLRRDKRMMSADPTVEANNSDLNGVTAAAPFKAEPARTASVWGDVQSQSAGQRMSVAAISQQPYAPTEQYHQQPPQHHTHRHTASFLRDTRPVLGQHGTDRGQHVMNKTAADLLSPAISNTHDALHLLSEAAGRTEDLNRQQMEYRYSAANHPTSSTFNSSGSPAGRGVTPGISRTSSNAQQGTQMGWYERQKPGSAHMTPMEDVQEGVPQGPKSPEEQDYEKARRVWARLRFIRAGWFSVDEAMAYISYYFENLAPLSPIVLPDFGHPIKHITMLTEEPVLTVTLLTIASRHMKLTGNGANSRAYSIHEKLWSYLKGMIERLFWGQEKFANSKVPAGYSKPRQFTLSNPPSSGQADFGGHLRSLGTVEALLLLTDWHPRALHFPPGDDENTLLDTDPQTLDSSSGSDDKAQTGTSEGRLAFYKWLEPVWRSDRMSWMLLSTAQALAFELGIFDHKNDLKSSTESPSEQARKRRVRRLILVYVSQSSGRLGIPSMLPLPQWNQNTDPSYPDGPALSPQDYAIDMMQDCWMDISKIMHVTNQELFPSKEETSNLIKSGKYRERIDEFMPSLRDFKKKFSGLSGSMTPHMRYILTIEYEYTRLHVNCLALQAVVDRWTNMPNEAAGSDGLSLKVLMTQYEVNEPYIREVVDASRKILQIVLDGLVPGNYLRHTPVRTFFRIMSGMIFILKTFTLGAKEDDVRISLELQDRTIDSLRTCVVDDVHLGVTIADLLQLLTENIRTRFLRFSDRADTDPSRERTPLPMDGQHDGDYARWNQNTPQNASAANAHAGANLAASNTAYTFENTAPQNPTPVTSQDPLANIPAQPIPMTVTGFTSMAFMPPPPSVFCNYYDSTGTSPKMHSTHLSANPDANQSAPTENPTSTLEPHALATDSNANTNGAATGTGTSGDWFALPLDHFFGNGTAGVDHGLGGTGPMVGEFDMLEVLLKEQYTTGTGAGATGGAAGHGEGGE